MKERPDKGYPEFMRESQEEQFMKNLRDGCHSPIINAPNLSEKYCLQHADNRPTTKMRQKTPVFDYYFNIWSSLLLK